MTKVNGTAIPGAEKMETPADEWPEPIPFDAEVFGPPPPLDAFPKVLADYALAVTRTIESPAGLSAAAALGVSAIACQGKGRVEIGSGDHVEPLCDYVSGISEPGERKTATMRAWVEPLKKHEAELGKRVALEVQENATAIRVAHERAKKLEAQAVAAEDEKDQQRFQREAARLRAEAPSEMGMPQLYTDDCTPEALAEKTGMNKGRMAICAEEAGTTFGIMAGRYDKNGAPNIDIYLNGYDAGEVRVNRKSRPDPSIVPHAHISMLLMPQPALAQEVGKDPKNRDRGLPARIGWVWPAPMVGEWTYPDLAIPQCIRDRYENVVRALLDRPTPEYEDMPRLRIRGEAYQVWRDYALHITAQLKPEGKLRQIAPGYASKHAGRAARIAARWHMVEHALEPSMPPDISVETVRKATRVADWLLENALVFFERAGLTPAEALAKRILEWIRRTRPTLAVRGRDGMEGVIPDAFNMREVNRFLHGKHLELQRQAIDNLIGRDFLRERPAPAAKSGRTPSPAFDVNPAAFRDTSTPCDKWDKCAETTGAPSDSSQSSHSSRAINLDELEDEPEWLRAEEQADREAASSGPEVAEL